MPRIKCLEGAPIQNRKEGVALWNIGDEHEIREVTGYWQGLIDRGLVAIVEEVPLTEREELEAMNVPTLKGLAQAEGVEVAGLKKAELIDAILADRAAKAAADAPVEETEDGEPVEDEATEADGEPVEVEEDEVEP